VLGQSSINWAMGHLSAAFSSLTLLMNPFFSAVFAWPILGEVLTPLQIVAGFAIMAGILVARRASTVSRRP
jgi:drug/metabolite transporter (DMT)-like permease